MELPDDLDLARGSPSAIASSPGTKPGPAGSPEMHACPICNECFADTEALIKHVDACLGSPAPRPPPMNPDLAHWLEHTGQALDRILAGSISVGQLAQLERIFGEQLQEVRMMQIEREQTPVARSPGSRLREDEQFARQLAAEFDAASEQEKELRESEEQAAFEALVASELSCVACNQLQEREVDVRVLGGCEHRVCRGCVTATIMHHLDCGGTGPIQCPLPGCSSVLAQADARALSSSELFERHTRFTLECAIEATAELVKCPKCTTVVEVLVQAPEHMPDSPVHTMATGRGLDGARVSKEAQMHAERHRFRCRSCDTIFCSCCGRVPYHIGFSCDTFAQWNAARKCVYCQGVWGSPSEPLNPEHNLGQLKAALHKKHTLDCKDWGMPKQGVLMRANHLLEHVCAQPDCRANASIGCLKPLGCGHLCGGVLQEESCLPCMEPECAGLHGNTRDDFCNVCWVADLGSAPCVLLGCGHTFHAECIRGQVQQGYSGARISFGHLGCPLCKKTIQHPWLASLMAPGLALYQAVKDKATKRLEFEKLADDPQIASHFGGDPVQFALKKFAYYSCHKCGEPYFGGHRNCEELEEDREFDPAELVCSRCSAVGGSGAECSEHGAEYIEWKCKFCCSIASWFCWGNTHFCDDCHKKQGTPAAMTKKKKADLPVCAGASCCPLKVEHPPSGTEFCLGCAICRNNTQTW